MITRVLIAFLLITAFSGAGAQVAYTEDEKIDHLITAIRALRNAVFIRNGSDHTATQAADHLAMKRRRAGKRVKTVEDFITGIASKSSLSGEVYMVRMANGKTYSAEMLLRLELKRLMEGKTKLMHPSLSPVEKNP